MPKPSAPFECQASRNTNAKFTAAIPCKLCLALRYARFLLDEFVKYGGKLCIEPECDVAVPPGLVISVGSILEVSGGHAEFVEQMRRPTEAEGE
jgi:hypothetical protein